MAVMAREIWTGERLGDFKLQVEKDFDEVKGDLRELRNARFDSVQRTMIIGFASIVASVIGAGFSA